MLSQFSFMIALPQPRHFPLHEMAPTWLACLPQTMQLLRRRSGIRRESYRRRRR
jgi:hypothetical protein